MFGADATLTVVHQCEVTQPVIEIATLIDHEQGGPSWSWWGFTPSLRPVETRAAPGVRTRITSCSGVSIGTGNVQHTIIRHRMTSCPVDLAVLLGNDDIRTALVRCRDDSLDPAERDDAKEHLRRIVTRVVGLTDTSALMPGGVIAARAAAAGDLPTVRGGGASLTVLHGVGVAVGWSPRVTGRTTTRVGRFHIR
jgi:hypothetical protein